MIRVHQWGGPEELHFEDAPVPKPGEGQALVKLAAIGLNFIDIYHRTGLYKLPLPFTPGMEAAGVVEEVGGGVSEVVAGDRVAYAMSVGAYSQYALVPSWKLIRLLPSMDFETAAASMLQGMTAHYLTHATYPIKKGDTVLVHAAAGGAGLLIIQMAKQRGARVLGTVSTEAKANLAREAGADEVIHYTETDFETAVKNLTSDKGVQVAYDSVGKTTFEKSLKCLAPRGFLVLFGQSSGPVSPFDPALLSVRGSLFLTRPSLANYASDRQELESRAGDVLGWVSSGQLKIRIGGTYSLSEAAEAHRQLEGRLTTGKILLLP